MSTKTEYVVEGECAGNTLAQFLRNRIEGTSWNRARELCRRGKVQVNGQLATDATCRLQSGDRIEVNPTAPRWRPDALDRAALVHCDAQVVVVNKPAGVISVPCARNEHNTLVDQTHRLLRGKRGFQRQPLGVVHRLDVGTTGLLVFTRTLFAKRYLKLQFLKHSIERRYLAIAHGTVEAGTVDTCFVPDRGDGLRGSFGRFRRARGPLPAGAQRAITHVKPLRALRGATLVECTLETGRQHQIRIHLSEQGHPLIGETIYIRDFPGPLIPAPRPLLHAAVLGFEHPASRELVRYEAPPPADFTAVLERLALR